MSGSWPPSKYGGTPPPARAFWPLVPLPPVLTLPLPWPRPMRMRSRLLPVGGFSSWICMGYSSTTCTRWLTFATIPRVAGLSVCSTTWRSFLRPSAVTVARWRALLPMGLRTSCSLSVRVASATVLLFCHVGWRGFGSWWSFGGQPRCCGERRRLGRRRSWCAGWWGRRFGDDRRCIRRRDLAGRRDLCREARRGRGRGRLVRRDGLVLFGCCFGRGGASGRGCGGCGSGRDAAAHLHDFLRVAQVGQCQQSRLDHVDRVRAAQRLGQDVLDARGFDDRAHGAARDHASTWRGRLEQDFRGAKLLHDLVRDRRASHRHADQIFPRALGALANRIGHLIGFAQADANVARAIADHNDRAEREAAAALDDFGHAVDLDDFLFEGQAGRTDLFNSWHLSRLRRWVSGVGCQVSDRARIADTRDPTPDPASEASI